MGGREFFWAHSGLCQQKPWINPINDGSWERSDFREVHPWNFALFPIFSLNSAFPQPLPAGNFSHSSSQILFSQFSGIFLDFWGCNTQKKQQFGQTWVWRDLSSWKIPKSKPRFPLSQIHKIQAASSGIPGVFPVNEGPDIPKGWGGMGSLGPGFECLGKEILNKKIENKLKNNKKKKSMLDEISNGGEKKKQTRRWENGIGNSPLGKNPIEIRFAARYRPVGALSFQLNEGSGRKWRGKSGIIPSAGLGKAGKFRKGKNPEGSKRN